MIRRLFNAVSAAKSVQCRLRCEDTYIRCFKVLIQLIARDYGAKPWNVS